MAGPRSSCAWVSRDMNLFFKDLSVSVSLFNTIPLLYYLLLCGAEERKKEGKNTKKKKEGKKGWAGRLTLWEIYK